MSTATQATKKNHKKAAQQIVIMIDNINSIIDATTKALGSVSKRQQVFILTGLLVEIKANKLILTGSDAATTSRACSEGIRSSSDCSFVVPAKLFSDVLKKLPSGKAKIIYTGKAIEILAEKARFHLNVLDASEYPQSVVKPLDKKVRINSGHTDLYERIISICPYQVHEKDDCDVNGYYHFEDDDITILSTNSTTQKLKTLIHEWSHAKLHNQALKERKVNSALMEVEVESIEFIVCHKLGIDTSQYSFGYIAGWGSGEEALKKIEESGMYIQQCAKEILDTIIPVLQNSVDPSTMEVNRQWHV